MGIRSIPDTIPAIMAQEVGESFCRVLEQPGNLNRGEDLDVATAQPHALHPLDRVVGGAGPGHGEIEQEQGVQHVPDAPPGGSHQVHR